MIRPSGNRGAAIMRVARGNGTRGLVRFPFVRRPDEAVLDPPGQNVNLGRGQFSRGRHLQFLVPDGLEQQALLGPSEPHRGTKVAPAQDSLAAIEAEVPLDLGLASMALE